MHRNAIDICRRTRLILTNLISLMVWGEDFLVEKSVFFFFVYFFNIYIPEKFLSLFCLFICLFVCKLYNLAICFPFQYFKCYSFTSSYSHSKNYDIGTKSVYILKHSCVDKVLLYLLRCLQI